MATTHKTVHSTGGGDYTTIGAALAASSSGSVGDYSTVTILDSATYAEKIDFTGKTFLRVTCEAGQNPVISQANLCVDMLSGADYVEVVGADASSKITLSLNASGAGTRHVAVGNTVNYRLAFLTFHVGGISCDGITHSAHTASAVIEDCDLSYNVNGFRCFLSGAVDNLSILRSDFSGAPLSNGLMEVNRLGLTIDRCIVPSIKLLRAVNEGNGVIAASKWRITNNIFIGTAASNPFLQLWDPLFGDGPNANVWNNLFVGDSAGVAIQVTGAVGLMADLDIRNNGFVGWTTAVTSASALTISYNGFFDCGTNAKGSVTSTDDRTGDPLLDGDYRPGVGSDWLDKGATIAAVTTDYAGTARPKFGGVGLLYDIGAYEVDLTPPDLVSAGADTQTQITATFSEEVTGADLTDVLAWTLEPVAGGSALAIEEITCTDGINAVLTLSDLSPVQSGLYYRVTCPDTLTDTEGILIGTTTAEFRSPVWPEEIVPWTPPSAHFTLDGVAIDYLPLLPEDGEPTGATLLRAAWLSLLCHRKAGLDVTLPDPWADPPYRGGWFGDTFATFPGDLWGSLLWTLSRYRGSDAPARAEEAVRQALAWMIEDGLAASVTCRGSVSGSRLDLDITIAKGASRAALRFDLWEGL